MISYLLLKGDVAKAFDSISWPFGSTCLGIKALAHGSLGGSCIAWVSYGMVMVNGVAGTTFRHGRWLRQGYSISRLLFVIAMDVLLGFQSVPVSSQAWV
jgi:hypothetical protein